MTSFVQVSAKDLEPGDIVTSGSRSLSVKDVGIDKSNICVSFWSERQTMEVHPDARLLVEREDSMYEELSTETTKNFSRDPEDGTWKPIGYAEDGSYTTPGG